MSFSLEARGLWFRYRAEWTLQDVSLAVPPGEFLGVIGPNGSGKTTLLRLLDGILEPERGGVLLKGRELKRCSRREIARLVAVVPQEAPFEFPFAAEEVVAMGRSPHLAALAFEGAADLAVVRRAMESTDTWRLRDRNVNSLSGGERQRVLIARALAQEPEVVLLDEPTAFLDLRHQVELFELAGRLASEAGRAVVAVSHDINLASQYCRRIVLLREGKAFRVGSPDEVIRSEALAEAYGVKALVDVNPVSGTPRVTLAGLREPGERETP